MTKEKYHTSKHAIALMTDFNTRCEREATTERGKRAAIYTVRVREETRSRCAGVRGEEVTGGRRQHADGIWRTVRGE